MQFTRSENEANKRSMNQDIVPPSYKVVVLGDSSVGKTSLVHRFTTDSFNANISNTIGAAFITKLHSSPSDPAKAVKLEMWDTAGQERYRSLTPMYYRNAKIALLCFDLNNVTETLVTAKYWVDQLNLYNAGTEEVKITLIGTKSDLYKETSEAEDEIRRFCEANNLGSPYKTSAKTGDGVNTLFDNLVEAIPTDFFDNYYKKKREEQTKNTGGVQFLGSLNHPTSSSCC